MENKEEEKVDNSRSATVLKTIYTILIVVILINCIVLIASIVLKSDSEPIVSKHQIIVKDRDSIENELLEGNFEEDFTETPVETPEPELQEQE